MQPAVPVVETISAIRSWSRAARARGVSVGLVPTMGALHEGHLSLIRRAAAECAEVIVSVFVNPMQFNDARDLAAYPRSLDADVPTAASAGATAIFAPSEGEMYSFGAPLTRVEVSRLTDGLCGAARPGHFAGMATVVTKLLAACEPDRAYFGEKDYQQLVVVTRMVDDLNLAVRIVPCPTVREPDGLAMSSRNARLSPAEREQAPLISRALRSAEAAFRAGERDAAELVRLAREVLAGATLGAMDYVELVDARDLTPVTRVGRDALLAVAVRFPSARLIDNVVLRV